MVQFLTKDWLKVEFSMVYWIAQWDIGSLERDVFEGSNLGTSVHQSKVHFGDTDLKPLTP